MRIRRGNLLNESCLEGASPHWTIFDPGSSGKPRKRRIQSRDLDLGCLRLPRTQDSKRRYLAPA